MDDKETGDIKQLVDNAGIPENHSPAGIQSSGEPTQKPGKTSGAKVVNMIEDNAYRLAFERKINETEDFDKLIFGLAADVQKSALRKASKENLLKQIAKKAKVSLEALRQSMPMDNEGGYERGRVNGGFLPYEILGNQFYVFDEKGRRPLSNFVAHIAEEIIYDTGAEAETLFRIEGRLSDETPLPPIEVSASRFLGMGWVSGEWGARPLVHAGNSIKDHLRAAIQGLVPCERRRTVYGHTGWRKLGEDWFFLHGGGAIGADGYLQDAVEVRPGDGNMRRYRFDAASDGDLCADIRSSLLLLDISTSNPALGVVLLAAVYRSPLGEAAPIDHGVFLAGQTGSRKSEAAAMAMAHFGRGFNARNFPANWDDTESDLEAKSHGAKDCLFVVDDFKPRGASNDVYKLHMKADRLFRSVGNQSGRGRRTSDMRQRPSYHPRGLVISTGEDIPRGASLRARLALVELSAKDVDNGILSELQQAAREGALERAMGCFLVWLAKDMDEWKREIPGALRASRDEAIKEGFAKAHPRASDIYASLLIGLGLFFKFAAEAGAITEEDKATQMEACQGILKDLIAAQCDLQADQDEVLQFLGYLKSCLNAGLCHFGDSFKQGAPIEHPNFWGWRVIPGSDGLQDIEKPQGELIGWVDSVRVYLDGNAAFAAAQEMAKATGDNLAITQRSLWARMGERGLLLDVKTENGKIRYSSQKVVAGVKRRAYIMSRKTLEDGTE
ncbi:MAG: hypothetical protein PHE55_18260 [Methylococcaceae bacterium]|nr:hypothetical protein [Methylococcaceae bacterium]